MSSFPDFSKCCYWSACAEENFESQWTVAHITNYLVAILWVEHLDIRKRNYINCTLYFERRNIKLNTLIRPSGPTRRPVMPLVPCYLSPERKSQQLRPTFHDLLQVFLSSFFDSRDEQLIIRAVNLFKCSRTSMNYTTFLANFLKGTWIFTIVAHPASISRPKPRVALGPLFYSRIEQLIVCDVNLHKCNPPSKNSMTLQQFSLSEPTL